VPELTRALRALSSAYVERRQKVAAGAPLDSAGKRAAFALFYGPLHHLCIDRVVSALDARVPKSIIDIGCGTGAAGAAWALRRPDMTRLSGIDRNRWAVDEARWTYRTLGLSGTARIGDLRRLPFTDASSGVLAAYVLNELPHALRGAVENQLIDAAKAGAAILIVEPIARSVAPWWDDTATRFRDVGGRADEWRFEMTLPPLLEKFDRAAGLRHAEMKCRTIAVNLTAAPMGGEG
jgi:SAM-dependent methyltransferase